MKVAVHMNDQRIEDIFAACWDGGSNYWIESISARPAAPDFACVVKDRHETKTVALYRAKVERGAALCAEKHGLVFGRLLTETKWDAADADVFLQLCLFGEVVYG